MRTLANHTIIYDADCPLCVAYTGAFEKAGMLEEGGRVAYSKVGNELRSSIDMDRARNEIALVDKTKNTVIYGIDSLFKVIGHRFRLLGLLFRIRMFRNLMKEVYSFISYNRKVIIPAKPSTIECACVPDLKVGYRWAYIGFTWLATAWILGLVTQNMYPILPEASFIREFLVCGGQIVFQAAFVELIAREKTLDYLGNLMTVSFAGALALLPGLLLAIWVEESWFHILYFAAVVGLMLLEHIRRVSLLKLPWWITGAWALYRLIILALILA